MNHLCLFSGIGTWSLGFEKSNIKTIAFCEKDKDARQLLIERFDIPIFEDITKLQAKDLPTNIDVISASYPCQSISVAGKKDGLIDKDGNLTRSGLFYEVIRLARDIKPKYLVLENVGRQLKQDFDKILHELSSLGYVVEWHIMRATDFNLPHQRERLFIIAHSNIERRNAHIRETRQIHTNKERSSENSSEVGTECIAKPKSIRPVLSRGSLEEFVSSYSSRRPSLSDVCRVAYEFAEGIYDDRTRKGLEKCRKSRIKQLGNAIIYPVAEYIGQEIVKHYKDSL